MGTLLTKTKSFMRSVGDMLLNLLENIYGTITNSLYNTVEKVKELMKFIQNALKITIKVDQGNNPFNFILLIQDTSCNVVCKINKIPRKLLPILKYMVAKYVCNQPPLCHISTILLAINLIELIFPHFRSDLRKETTRLIIKYIGIIKKELSDFGDNDDGSGSDDQDDYYDRDYYDQLAAQLDSESDEKYDDHDDRLDDDDNDDNDEYQYEYDSSNNDSENYQHFAPTYASIAKIGTLFAHSSPACKLHHEELDEQLDQQSEDQDYYDDYDDYHRYDDRYDDYGQDDGQSEDQHEYANHQRGCDYEDDSDDNYAGYDDSMDGYPENFKCK